MPLRWWTFWRRRLRRWKCWPRNASCRSASSQPRTRKFSRRLPRTRIARRSLQATRALRSPSCSRISTRSIADADLAIAASDYAEMFDFVAKKSIVRSRILPEARVRIYGLLEARLTHAEPRRARWINRRHVAAGNTQRSVAEPADAPHAWSWSAGAACRPCRARFRATARRAAKSCSPARQSSPARRRLLRVSCSGSLRCAGERWKDVVGARRALSRMARGRSIGLTPTRDPSHGPNRAHRAAHGQLRFRSRRSKPGYAIPTRSMRDIFCNLHPLEPIDEPPGARDRGTMIHDAIGDFAESLQGHTARRCRAKLIAFGETFFAPLKDHPEARAFWWPRFLRIAQWFVGL